MSDLTGRFFRVAKGYLDAARERVADVDRVARAELDKALTAGEHSLPPPSSDDPMVRAQAKIDAARRASEAFQYGVSDTAPLPAPNSPALDPIQAAYRVIGVPVGSDLPTVQNAFTTLKDRCAPLRFPEGSPERTEAERLMKRIEDAYQTLLGTLDSTEGRFDRLEFN